MSAEPRGLVPPFTDSPDHSVLGWPKKDVCPHCGKPSALLHSTIESASYECRGNPPDPRLAYGEDRCGRVFEVLRENYPA